MYRPLGLDFRRDRDFKTFSGELPWLLLHPSQFKMARLRL